MPPRSCAGLCGAKLTRAGKSRSGEPDEVGWTLWRATSAAVSARRWGVPARGTRGSAASARRYRGRPANAPLGVPASPATRSSGPQGR